MKNQSPTNRMVQLRRKTEKIIIPKAYWDLSNKENTNLHNIYDSSKSKNHSSKKSSIEKKTHLIQMKKTLSMTQNNFQNTIKKMNKNQSMLVKQNKQKQIDKKKCFKKDNKQENLFKATQNRFLEGMIKVLRRANQKQSVAQLKPSYISALSTFNSKNEDQKATFNTMKDNLLFWIERCQALQGTLHQVLKQTPKLDVAFVQSQQISKQEAQEEEIGDTGNDQESQVSLCSYIVDPKQQIKMKPLKKQLKNKLQLNFQKVDLVRKKQYA